MDRFTNPIIFPDGWRLVIERYTMHSAYHIELHAIMVPPVQQESLAPDVEEEEYDILRETLRPQGCVMLPSVIQDHSLSESEG